MADEKNWLRKTYYALFCLLRILGKDPSQASKFFGPEFTLHLCAIYDELRVHLFPRQSPKGTENAEELKSLPEGRNDPDRLG